MYMFACSVRSPSPSPALCFVSLFPSTSRGHVESRLHTCLGQWGHVLALFGGR